MATPKTGDLLAGVPIEEQARILKLANAEWDAQYQAQPSAEVYTARQVADEARKAVILRELKVMGIPHGVKVEYLELTGSDLEGPPIFRNPEWPEKFSREDFEERRAALKEAIRKAEYVGEFPAPKKP